jgi:hypothetical protein
MKRAGKTPRRFGKDRTATIKYYRKNKAMLFPPETLSHPFPAGHTGLLAFLLLRLTQRQADFRADQFQEWFIKA